MNQMKIMVSEFGSWDNIEKTRLCAKDWQENKVKVMLLLNIAKYASDKDFQNQLLQTKEQGIEALPSTSNWTYWNSKIQLSIRDLLIEGKDLAVVLKELSICSSEKIKQFLEN